MDSRGDWARREFVLHAALCLSVSVHVGKEATLQKKMASSNSCSSPKSSHNNTKEEKPRLTVIISMEILKTEVYLLGETSTLALCSWALLP